MNNGIIGEGHFHMMSPTHPKKYTLLPSNSHAPYVKDTIGCG